jgi:undecaprenyl-diphosphatase
MNRPRHHLDIDRGFWLWTIAGAIAACGAGALYATMLRNTGEWATGLGWEIHLMRDLHATWAPPIDWALEFIPWLGTNLTIIPAMIVAAWHLRKRGRTDLIVVLVVSGIGNLMLGFFLKFAFDRPRPDLWPPRGEFTGPSYPSGHTMMATSLLFIAAYLFRRERQWKWPYVVCVMFALITSYSRIYLGVHWPTDVLGGAIIGTVWLAAMLRAMDAHADEVFEIERRSRKRTPG